MSPARVLRCARVTFWSPYLACVLAAHPTQRPYWRRWLELTLEGRTALDSQAPFMSFRAMEWLENYLSGREARVFEWGSGGSTLFFAARSREVVSVEHDPAWYRRVSQALAAAGLANCTLHHVPPDPEAEPAASPEPAAFYRSRRSGRRLFQAYARVIDAYPDGAFDLVVVDGRARPACTAHGMPKVKAGGVLILDDSRRRRYRAVLPALSRWQRLDLSGIRPGGPAIQYTTAWLKP